MIKQIVLNGRTISYDLERKNVKNLNLRIKPDQSVFVSANHLVAEATIEDFLTSKSEYILKALDHYEEQQKYIPKPKTSVKKEAVVAETKKGYSNKVDNLVKEIEELI